MPKHELQHRDAVERGGVAAILRPLQFRAQPPLYCPDMDKFWSIFTMPLGVALCFGPAMIVFWLTRKKEPSDDKNPPPH
jgi:hypothetical protein